MSALRQYILAVVCMTVACGVLQMLLTNGTVSSLVKIISGLVVSISVFSPLVKENLFHWNMQFESIVSDASDAIAQGQMIASEMVQQRIKERTEEYILTKASEMGADISPWVELKSEFPNEAEKVTIEGSITPYVKKRLVALISKDLGILEEDITWIS